MPIQYQVTGKAVGGYGQTESFGGIFNTQAEADQFRAGKERTYSGWNITDNILQIGIGAAEPEPKSNFERDLDLKQQENLQPVAPTTIMPGQIVVDVKTGKNVPYGESSQFQQAQQLQQASMQQQNAFLVAQPDLSPSENQNQFLKNLELARQQNIQNPAIGISQGGYEQLKQNYLGEQARQVGYLPTSNSLLAGRTYNVPISAKVYPGDFSPELSQPAGQEKADDIIYQARKNAIDLSNLPSGSILNQNGESYFVGNGKIGFTPQQMVQQLISEGRLKSVEYIPKNELRQYGAENAIGLNTNEAIPRIFIDKDAPDISYAEASATGVNPLATRNAILLHELIEVQNPNRRFDDDNFVVPLTSKMIKESKGLFMQDLDENQRMLGDPNDFLGNIAANVANKRELQQYNKDLTIFKENQNTNLNYTDAITRQYMNLPEEQKKSLNIDAALASATSLPIGQKELATASILEEQPKSLGNVPEIAFLAATGTLLYTARHPINALIINPIEFAIDVGSSFRIGKAPELFEQFSQKPLTTTFSVAPFIAISEIIIPSPKINIDINKINFDFSVYNTAGKTYDIIRNNLEIPKLNEISFNEDEGMIDIPTAKIPANYENFITQYGKTGGFEVDKGFAFEPTKYSLVQNTRMEFGTYEKISLKDYPQYNLRGDPVNKEALNEAQGMQREFGKQPLPQAEPIKRFENVEFKTRFEGIGKGVVPEGKNEFGLDIQETGREFPQSQFEDEALRRFGYNQPTRTIPRRYKLNDGITLKEGYNILEPDVNRNLKDFGFAEIFKGDEELKGIEGLKKYQPKPKVNEPKTNEEVTQFTKDYVKPKGLPEDYIPKWMTYKGNPEGRNIPNIDEHDLGSSYVNEINLANEGLGIFADTSSRAERGKGFEAYDFGNENKYNPDLNLQEFKPPTIEIKGRINLIPSIEEYNFNKDFNRLNIPLISLGRLNNNLQSKDYQFKQPQKPNISQNNLIFPNVSIIPKQSTTQRQAIQPILIPKLMQEQQNQPFIPTFPNFKLDKTPSPKTPYKDFPFDIPYPTRGYNKPHTSKQKKGRVSHKYGYSPSFAGLVLGTKTIVPKNIKNLRLTGLEIRGIPITRRKK